MAKRILQKVSFGLLRTNPKLTTNVKLVVDSTDNMFLESFNEIEELSDTRFKGYKISGGSYSQDIRSFYDNGKFPKEIAYKPAIKDDNETVKREYSEQYDMTYASGAYAKISKLYDEEFAILAPIWIEPLNIPDYFIIFKNPDPVSINTVGATGENLGDYSVGATNMHANIVSSSKIHAIIDLSENSNIGRYIRRHVLDELFPESPLKVNFKRNEFTEWNGISMDKGTFTSKSTFFHEDLLIRDKTIMETENLITNGFQNNGIICANILNLEFLFDDVVAENYEINRYFGFYCNAEDICKFKLDPDGLFDDKVLESTQIPVPKLRNIGTQDNLESQVQTNTKGIKIYADVKEGILPKSQYFSDPAYPRFGFVKDKNGKLYSVKNDGNWKDNLEIRIDDTSVDWQDFSGFDDAIDVVPAKYPKSIGRPSTTLEIVNTPSSGDQIRFRYTYDNVSDYITNTDQIETHTIIADSLLPAGTNVNRTYSSLGTLEQVAVAIRKAINSIIDIAENDNEIFRAVEIGTKVYVYSRFVNSLWNKITVQSFRNLSYDTILTDQPYIDAIGATYIMSPSSTLIPEASGFLSQTQFTGGNNNLRSRIIISVDDEEAFTTDRYLKTWNGYSKIKGVRSYIEEPTFDRIESDITDFSNTELYRIVEVEDGEDISLNSSDKVTLYETIENGAGFISFYPVKDFDFDFHNTDYTRDADANTTDLLGYLGDRYGIIGTTGYVGGTGSTGYAVINDIIGPTSRWQTEDGFIRLVGMVNETTGELALNEVNEYDRLKENENSLLVLESRIVPFINKWVFDDAGKDVRENDYRLSTSEAFRYSNFTPSFKHFIPDPKFYTHEWYYLQQYPGYMSDEEKTNAFSYFDTELDIADLYNVVEDKFVDYFAQDNFGINDFQTKFKYSIFSGGDNVNYATTFFRGAKIKIIERADESQTIDFNINDIRSKASDRFNDYKFSAVLTFDDASNIRFRVIKNDKFKHITFVIGVDLLDDLYLPGITGPNPARFLDRTMLYTMRHKYDIEKLGVVSGGAAFNPEDDVYGDIQIAGAFELFPPSGPYPIYNPNTVAESAAPEFPGFYRVFVNTDPSGGVPNLIRDMVPGESGQYQNITVTLDSSVIPLHQGVVTFDNIVFVSANSLVCENILFDRADGTSWDLINDSYADFPYTNIIKDFTATYNGGGYNSHYEVLKDISFASLADKINRGNPIIEYWNVDSSGTTALSNGYFLEILEPEQENKVTSFGIEDDLDRPTIFSTSAESIGSKTKFLNRTYVAPITRYNGNYSPRVYDVVQYINDVNNFKIDLIDQYNSQGATADVDTIIDNVTFGINQTGFGLIRNKYHNKVNENNPRGVLEINKSSGFKPVYPKTGEIAIDYSDFDVFKSNWDVAYYIENVSKNITEPRLGTRSMIEKRSYFGSKIMNLPDTIELESFDIIDIQNELIGGRELYLPSTENFDSVYKIFNAKKNSTISGNKGRTSKDARPFKPFTNPSKVDLWIYTEKALEKFLIADGIGDVFTKFINPAYSFGLKNSVDDDIKKYITANILKIYEIDSIELYELRYWKNPNNFDLLELGLSDVDRRTFNFELTKNFQTKNLTNSKLNFKLIYNIPVERKSSSISLKVKLRKK